MENPDFLQINLSRRMSAKGWSLKQFAQISGVSYHTIFRAVSKGITPRGSNLQKMAAALGCSVAELHSDPNQQQAALARPSLPLEVGAQEFLLLWEAYRQSTSERQLLALFLLTKDETYLHQFETLPSAPQVARALKTAL